MSASRGPFDFGASNNTVRKTLRRKYDTTGMNYKTLLGQNSKPHLQQKFQRYKPDVNPLAQDMASPEGSIEPTPARKVELLKDFYKNKMTALQDVYDDLPTVSGPNGTMLDVTRSRHFVAWMRKKVEAKGEPMPAEGSSKYNAMASTYTRVIDAKMQAYSSIIAQLNASGGAEAVLDAYLRGFHCFLRGRPTEEHQRKLKKLGLNPTFEPFRQESVQQYLKAFSRVKKEYYEDLAMLRMQGPTGNLHQIELYYKYIIDGKEDEKIEQNLWHWLEGGKLPKHTGRLLGKGSHTSLVNQLYQEFPVGTEGQPPAPPTGRTLGGAPRPGGGSGGGGGGGRGDDDNDDNSGGGGGGGERREVTPGQQTFLDSFWNAFQGALGVKQETEASAPSEEEVMSLDRELALAEQKEGEEASAKRMLERHDAAIAYVTNKREAITLDEVNEWTEEERNFGMRVYEYANLRDEFNDRFKEYQALQEEGMFEDAAMIADEIQAIDKQMLAARGPLEAVMTDAQKRALFAEQDEVVAPVDTTDVDNDDEKDAIVEEAAVIAEPLNEEAGAESDDEAESVPRKHDEGDERDRLPPGVEHSTWERARERMAELKDAEESVSPEDKALEQRVRALGGKHAEIDAAQPAASSDEALKSLQEAPVPPAAVGATEAPATAASEEAEQVAVEDEGAAFDASLARVIRDLFPEPPALKEGQLTQEDGQANVKRVEQWLDTNRDNAMALIEATLPQASSTASFSAHKQPVLVETLAQLDKAEAILKSAVEGGEGELKMTWEEFKRSSDQVYERMTHTPGTHRDMDRTLYETYRKALAPVRHYATAQFAHLLTAASIEVRNNDAAWTNTLLGVLQRANESWKHEANEAIVKNTDATNELAAKTAEHINNQMAEKFTSSVNQAIAAVNSAAEKAVKQATDASAFVLGKVPEEVQNAIMAAQKKALIFTGQATAVNNVVAPLKRSKQRTVTRSQQERVANERMAPGSKLRQPKLAHSIEAREQSAKSASKEKRKEAIAAARKTRRKFPASITQYSPDAQPKPTKTGKEKLSEKEEERVTRGY